jgi:2-iminobutanoate/2-iminopropanoate deaminase
MSTEAMKFIETQDADRSPVPISQAVRAGDTLYLSGQVGCRPGGEWATGEDFETEVRVTLDNVRAVVEAAGGSLRSICKVVAFLADPTLFERWNAVYREYFAAPFPARSTICCGLIRADLRIEIEAVAWLG